AEVAGSRAQQLPVARDLLAELGVGAWMGPASLPLWIDDVEWRGFATLDTSRARAAGLVTRPLDETLRDTLAFEEVRTEPRRAGLTDDDERRVQEAVLGAEAG
ncbi:MAG: oxidoreductase, partial [Ornithinibacter sp.]